MWIANPDQHFGRNEVDPIHLDPLCDVHDAVVLSDDAKHFYHLNDLLSMLEMGQALNPCTRRAFSVHDIRLVVTPRTRFKDIDTTLRLLLTCGWTCLPEVTSDLSQMRPAPPPNLNYIMAIRRRWEFLRDVMRRYAIPPIDMHGVKERWERAAVFERNPRIARNGETLLQQQRRGYAGKAQAPLHRLADRFLSMLDALCGSLRNAVFRRRPLVEAFVFVAFAHRQPVTLATAHRLVELRLELNERDPNYYVLRPFTALEAVRRAVPVLSRLERDVLRRPQRRAVIGETLQAATRRVLNAARRYSDEELVEAALQTYFERAFEGAWRLAVVVVIAPEEARRSDGAVRDLFALIGHYVEHSRSDVLLAHSVEFREDGRIMLGALTRTEDVIGGPIAEGLATLQPAVGL